MRAAVLVNVSDPLHARRYIELVQTNVRDLRLAFEPVQVLRRLLNILQADYEPSGLCRIGKSSTKLVPFRSFLIVS
jgi:hypothetical protein